jgi:hypothetical protein
MRPVNPAFPLHRAETPPARHVARPPLKGLLAVGLAMVALAVRAQTPELEVGVRSSVQEGLPRWNKEKTEAEGGHSMIYQILAIKRVDNESHLVRPVNEKRVVSLLMDTLDANGFREFMPGEMPGILITASYGRGEMSNPYIRDTGEVGGQSLPSSSSRPAQQKDGQDASAGGMSQMTSSPGTVVNGPPGVTITGAQPLQLFDEKANGYEQKLQKAQFEKLFIRVTAWDYPVGPKAKPRMLWKTIMVVDDPDHRDLNVVAAAMLAAGGPWFDKLHRDPEVEVHKPLPDGRVNVGPLEVREPFKLPPDK